MKNARRELLSVRREPLGISLLLPVICAITACVMAGCVSEAGIECMGETVLPRIPISEPHQKLPEYNFFKGALADLDPVDSVMPYDLRTPLFTDYAEKLRMIYVPAGQKIRYREKGVLDFPVGSVLIKNFYYSATAAGRDNGRRLIETRLLLHRSAGWHAETYVWNAAQDEALLKSTGDRVEVAWTDSGGRNRMVDYLIPTRNDCKTCHSAGNRILPIGPKAANLNREYAYEDGSANQLERWEEAGLLEGKPLRKAIPRAAVWDDPNTGTLNDRARSYLDVNCGHCHNPSGSANNSGLFLNRDQEDALHLGVCKPPVAAGPGSGGLRYSIVPCQPEESIMIYRLASVDPEKRMPELGRTLVHEEGVALIKAWIEEMTCTSCTE